MYTSASHWEIDYLYFQVRSQEEIMNECQVWWTITGNFGNMMPIDWSKSTARAKQLSTLNLCNPRYSKNTFIRTLQGVQKVLVLVLEWAWQWVDTCHTHKILYNFYLMCFFTCSENFIILSLFKIDLWQHQQKKTCL